MTDPLASQRALLVIIGVAAATIFMLFPTPQSTRLLVRRTHATCIDEIGRIYSAILASWLSEDRRDEAKASDVDRETLDHHVPSAFTVSVQKAARARMLALWVKLDGTRVNILQSSYEISMRGNWPKKEYLDLLRTQLTIVQGLAQLGQALVRLDPAWRKIIVRSTAFLNPNLVSAFSALFRPSLTNLVCRSPT